MVQTSRHRWVDQITDLTSHHMPWISIRGGHSPIRQSNRNFDSDRFRHIQAIFKLKLILSALPVGGRHSISRISRLYSVSVEIVKKLSPFNLNLRLKGLSPETEWAECGTCIYTGWTLLKMFMSPYGVYHFTRHFSPNQEDFIIFLKLCTIMLFSFLVLSRQRRISSRYQVD